VGDLTDVGRFFNFFQQVDNFRSDFFLWLSAAGLEKASIRPVKGDRTIEQLDARLGDEDEDPEGGEG
jgi:tRNA pseudouridine38-40 synthase